jgi:hypothetical protein
MSLGRQDGKQDCRAYELRRYLGTLNGAWLIKEMKAAVVPEL